MKDLFTKNSTPEESKYLEREADECAAKAIECPLCMQAIYDGFPRSNDRAQKGYLIREDIVKYLKTNKFENYCDAHKNCASECAIIQELVQQDNQKLSYFAIIVAWMNKSAEKRLMERLELDFKIGSVRDRLSNIVYKFKEPVAETIIEHPYASWTKRLE